MSNLRLTVLLALAVSTSIACAADAPRHITGATPLRLDGIGAIRIGMRLREAIKATGMKFTDPKKFEATDDTNACTYVSFRSIKYMMTIINVGREHHHFVLPQSPYLILTPERNSHEN